MASSYSTDLKLEIQVTGENAGTWGDITNTNLVILQQAIAGYQTVALNATTGATLTFSNGALSNGKKNFVPFSVPLYRYVDNGNITHFEFFMCLSKDTKIFSIS